MSEHYSRIQIDPHTLERDRFYEQKRVEVFYTVEGDGLITVTVYVFYARWEVNGADSV